MKGFVEKTASDGIFFVIKHHTICRESKTAQPGFKETIVTNPKTNEQVTKYIQSYDALEAMITKIEWYDTEQKYTARYRGWKIHLNANGKHGVLDLPITSRVASRFMKLAENIDYTKPVEFKAWKDSKSDSTALMVAQDGKSVPQKYTRENPGDLPPPVQRASTGKWNYGDQMEFLHKRMLEVVIPKVAAAQPAETATTQNAPEESDPFGDDEGEDDTSEVHADTARTLEEIKGIIKGVAGSKEAEGRTKAQLLNDYFGTSNWSEVEKLPVDLLQKGFKQLDDLVPF